MMMMMMMMTTTTTMMLLISKWIVRHFGRQYVKILILFLFLYWTTTRSRRYVSSSERERFLEPTWLRVHQFNTLKNPEITRRIPYLFHRISVETLDDKDKNTYLHHICISLSTHARTTHPIQRSSQSEPLLYSFCSTPIYSSMFNLHIKLHYDYNLLNASPHHWWRLHTHHFPRCWKALALALPFRLGV